MSPKMTAIVFRHYFYNYYEFSGQNIYSSALNTDTRICDILYRRLRNTLTYLLTYLVFVHLACICPVFYRLCSKFLCKDSNRRLL